MSKFISLPVIEKIPEYGNPLTSNCLFKVNLIDVYGPFDHFSFVIIGIHRFNIDMSFDNLFNILSASSFCREDDK